MPGTARMGSAGENISHFNAVRFRINGVGEMELTFYSLDDIKSQVLLPLNMLEATNIQPTRLANFIEQRAYLKGETNGLGEWFRINRIIVFQKELFSSYPG